jgi:UDP-glucose 4-epimerase
MKILVTGGAGFVGSHLVNRLIKEGNRVIVIDNLSTGKKENLNPKAKFYKLDIRNPKISQIFKKEKPEIVFHYAAQIDIRKSIENPIRDANINILGTINVLENCKRFKAKKFIFASSVGVYGEPKKLPVKENYSLDPISPYPIAKLTIENYLNYYQTLGLNFVSLRYSNIFGPRQSSKGEGGVIAIFIDKLFKGKRPIIYGSGRQTRDFLYIDDAIEAAIKALKAPPGSIYNVGANKEIAIGTLFKKISSELKIKTNPIFHPARQGEIIKSRIDFRKIKKELNWRPKYNLDKGIKKTINWLKIKFYEKQS